MTSGTGNHARKPKFKQGINPKINQQEEAYMKHRVYYGMKPVVNQLDPRDFSRGDYECCQLFQNGNGTPIIVSRSKTHDIWKVECGFSCVHFGTKAEALAYCNGRFHAADELLV